MRDMSYLHVAIQGAFYLWLTFRIQGVAVSGFMGTFMVNLKPFLALSMNVKQMMWMDFSPDYEQYDYKITKNKSIYGS